MVDYVNRTLLSLTISHLTYSMTFEREEVDDSDPLFRDVKDILEYNKMWKVEDLINSLKYIGFNRVDINLANTSSYDCYLSFSDGVGNHLMIKPKNFTVMITNK